MTTTRKRWTAEEVEKAVKMYEEHQPVEDIAECLGRTKWAIYGKLGKLDVMRKQASYDTHYRCHRCGWILKEDCIEESYGYLCPHCGDRVRQVSRWHG